MVRLECLTVKLDMRPNPIPNHFFQENRLALMRKLDANSLILMQSANVMVQNGDINYPFLQDPNFFYYTGIEAPGCSLLLVPGNNGNPESTLFIPPVDPEKEKWEGKMLTKEKAQELSGIEVVRCTDMFLPIFFKYQKWRENLYCEINDVFPSQSLSPNHLFLEDLAKRLPGLRFRKLHKLTSYQRFKKRSVELDRLRKSIEIIKLALEKSLGRIKPGTMEYQIEAELKYHYLDQGCSRLGFEIIAAGGRNATYLHYTKNDSELRDGDLVLIDTGGSYGGYSGDITRTFPVSGKFSRRQKQCYQAVLDVQKAFMREVRPGRSWNQLLQVAEKITAEIYTDYRLIKEPRESRRVSCHRIGHFLGLDIHDVGNLNWPLEAGAVVTVEPGLYLPEEGLGIRIEDNLLITESGTENLSRDIVKEVDAIEQLAGRHSS